MSFFALIAVTEAIFEALLWVIRQGEDSLEEEYEWRLVGRVAGWEIH